MKRIPLKQEQCLKLLKTTKEVLNKNKISFWLHAGTLLGAIRDKQFIPWDDDIDLGCWQLTKEQVKSVTDELYSKGLDLFVSYKKIRIVNSHNWLTIWYFDKEDDNVTKKKHYMLRQKNKKRFLTYLFLDPLSATYVDKVHNPKKSIRIAMSVKRLCQYLPFRLQLYKALVKLGIDLEFYKEHKETIPFTKLKTIKFYDINVGVPDNAEDYLLKMYGKDWKTPKKEWFWWDELSKNV